MPYKTTIGLEIHSELKTKTKMFCNSLNDPNETRPNINICPVCLAHPGSLPVINYDAVEKVIMAGLALDCKINQDTFFERKNYFYPDLPKGYQISQYQKPLCHDGHLTLHKSEKKIRIERIHLEEDAGRLIHAEGHSLVDFNRAGVPLMELVTKPDFETGEEVREFAEELQLILKHLNISDADMEKGLMRVEVNISVSDSDKLGTKVEIKNLNSIRAAADSIEYETKRQREVIENGEKVKQETRGWDENKKGTFSQRSKEEAHDYRYFPEPDLPPLKFSNEDIEKIKAKIGELPQERRERFKERFGLPDSDIDVFTINKSLGDYFENVTSELLSFDKLTHLKRPDSEHNLKLFKLASNYLITELQKLIYESGSKPEDIKINPGEFADFIVRIFHGEISSSGAQILLREMFTTGESPDTIIREKDLAQISGTNELDNAVNDIIKKESKAVEDYRKGKKESLKFLIGRVMAITKGKGNPEVIAKILEEKLSR